MEYETLPLLDYSKSLFDGIDLSKILLIASQHILESQRIMFEYLIEKGLKPSNIFLVGKCYSTNQKVLERFKQRGIYISLNSIKFESYLSFDKQFDSSTKELLNFVKNKVNIKDYERVVILGEGGSLLSQTSEIFEDTSNFVGIEQTSAGYEKLKNLKFKFPIINVARSKTKLKVESPMIADAGIKIMKRELKNLNLNPKKILILGSGAIGNALYKKLKSNYEVKRYDLNSKISDYEKENLKSILKDFDMVIGSTGKEIIDFSLYKYLKKDVVLVSISSSDREFSAVNLRKMHKKIKNCHKNIKVENINLLNCGFPINFDGDENSVAPKDIQITLSLIFSAICLAVKEPYGEGLIELDKNIQKKIANEFNKIK